MDDNVALAINVPASDERANQQWGQWKQCKVLRVATTILLFAVRYSWDIYGIFMEYSWGIHMYRVCVGYISGMCRECVERNGMRLGSYSCFVREKCQCAWIKSNYWSGLVCLTWASICMKRSPKLIDHTSIHWLRNTGSSKKVFANESRMVACVCHTLT